MFKEIVRVLSDGGEAFIYPFHWSGGPDFQALEHALSDIATHADIEWKWIGEHGEDLDGADMSATLWVKKRM